MIPFVIKSRLILKKEDKILLLAQTTKNGGKFSLPGGTVEGGEFALETLIRECEEEIGIHIAPEDLELVHVLHKKKGGENRVTFYFKTQIYKGQIRVRETKKFRGVTWGDLYAMPAKTSSTVKHVVKQLILGEKYSQFSKK